MFVVYEVCSGWSEESYRFSNRTEAEELATKLWEDHGTEHQVREEAMCDFCYGEAVGYHLDQPVCEDCALVAEDSGYEVEYN